MKIKSAKKIARRWVLREWVYWYKRDYPPWKKRTINKALDIWYDKRFQGNYGPTGAW